MTQNISIPKRIFKLKFCWTRNLLNPKFFRTQNFYGAKISWGWKFFCSFNFFNQFFLNTQFLLDQNVFYPKISLNPELFWTKIFFSTQNICGRKIFRAKKFFGPKMFSELHFLTQAIKPFHFRLKSCWHFWRTQPGFGYMHCIFLFLQDTVQCRLLQHLAKKCF